MKNKTKKWALLAATATVLLILLIPQHVSSESTGQNAQSSVFMSLIQSIVEVILDMIFGIMSSLFSALEDSLLANPQIYPLKDGNKLNQRGEIFKGIFLILAPIYSMAVIIIGTYMIFISHSPRGRAQAKMMLDKIIVSMVVLPASPAIYELLLHTSNVMARSVISTLLLGTGKDSIGAAIGGGLARATSPLWVLFLIFPYAAGVVLIWLLALLVYITFMALIIMWFRYLTVLVFAFLFPLTLFLYLFQWTRHIGAMLMKYTLVWIFTPVISAVFLASGLFMVYASPTGSHVAGLMSDFSLGAVVSTLAAIIIMPILMMVSLALTWIAPLVMSGLMRVLGGIVSAVGMVLPGPYGMALAAAGGIMQGKSAAELGTVGLKYAGRRSMGALKQTKVGKKFSSILKRKEKGPDVKAADGSKPAAAAAPSKSKGSKPKVPGVVAGAKLGAKGVKMGAKAALGGKVGGAKGAAGAAKGGKAAAGGAGKPAAGASAGKAGKPGAEAAKAAAGGKPAAAAGGGAAKAADGGGGGGKKPGFFRRLGSGAVNAAKESQTGRLARTVGRGASRVGRAAGRGSVVGAVMRTPAKIRSVRDGITSGIQHGKNLRSGKVGGKGARGRLASTWGGIKKGFAEWNGDRNGEGGGTAGAKKLSHDVRRAQSKHGLTDGQAQAMQDAGLTSNNKIAGADQNKLANIVGADKAGEVKHDASSAKADEDYIKTGLASAPRRPAERGADLADNFDIPDEQGM